MQRLDTHMENKGSILHVWLGDQGAALLPRMCVWCMGIACCHYPAGEPAIPSDSAKLVCCRPQVNSKNSKTTLGICMTGLGLTLSADGTAAFVGRQAWHLMVRGTCT